MNRTDDYIRPRGYYDNPGTLLTATFAQINNLVNILNPVLSSIALFKPGTGTYTDNDTSQTFTDSFCSTTSLVVVSITGSTPAGIWSVASGNGSFTITSTAAESTDITFDYYIIKAV